MSDGLLDPLRHNSWATRELLAFCSGLDSRQLGASEAGTYGSVLETLQHLLGAEGRYLFRLTDGRPDWSRKPEETEDLGELATMADDLARTWEELLATGDFDGERVVSWTSAVSGAHTECRAGILVAQTLNHGNEHRAHIGTIIGALGMDAPELDGWGYAIATGRFREDPPRT